MALDKCDAKPYDSGMRNGPESLTEYLKAAGWSQTELARRCKITGSAVSRMLSGDRRIGRYAASVIEKVTLAAVNETRVAPLLAEQLLDVAEPAKKAG